MWSITTKISFFGCYLFAHQSLKIFDKRQVTNIDYYDHPSLPSSLDNEIHRGVHGVSFTPEQELFAVRNRNGDLNEIVERLRRSDPTGQSVATLGLRFEQELLLFEMIELESWFDELQYDGDIQKGEEFAVNMKPCSIAELRNETVFGQVEPIVCLPVSLNTKQKAIFGRTLTGNNKKSSSAVPTLNSEHVSESTETSASLTEGKSVAELKHKIRDDFRKKKRYKSQVADLKAQLKLQENIAHNSNKLELESLAKIQKEKKKFDEVCTCICYMCFSLTR